MALNRNEDAIKDFQKFLEYVPGDAEIYNLIGNCYMAVTKYQESLIPINKAIEIRPDPRFYLNRSRSYYEMRNMEAAKKDALTAKQAGLQIDAAYANLLGIQ